jgi:hypothetical protein
MVEETKIELAPIKSEEIEKATTLIKEKYPLVKTDVFTALPYLAPIQPFVPDVLTWW